MTRAPTANEITVREVLQKFETEFAPVAQAVENGEYALWVGSGISRQAPNLGNLIERAFDYIRERAIDPETQGAYLPALEEALVLAELEPTRVTAQYGQPLALWPEYSAVIARLWNKYSRVLDIRIAGTESDFILWNAIDIRKAFEHPAPPAAEHLCIAILILEGAVKSIASANWDGFIEAAIEQLSNATPGIMQVVVDPDQLRGPTGLALLLKFHGCVVHATREPTVFRRFLTGSHTQIMDWPEKAEFAAMCNAVVNLATTRKTLVLGLSIQDNNLQTLFARAKAAHAWPCPCAGAAPAHVFCESEIQQGQRDVLRLLYGDAYNHNPDAIAETTLLRAWAEQVLIALVLKLITDKLARLMELTCALVGNPSIADALSPSLKAWRDDLADFAVPAAGAQNRTAIVTRGVQLWSRMLSLFRSGTLPANPNAYEAVSNTTPILIAADQNAQAMGLGRLGVALSLLQIGRAAGHWELRQPHSDDLTAGAMTACAKRPNAAVRPLFIVKSATEAISLKSNWPVAKADMIVIHADDTWRKMVPDGKSPRRVSAAPGRTGGVGETHVSLGELLERCNDAASLKESFVAEIML